MSIKKAKIEDVVNILDLIVRSAEPESNSDFNEEGIKYFYEINQISSIKSRILNEEYLTLCFHKNYKVIGILAIHKNIKIDQMFVDPSYRNIKISRQLWDVAKELCAGNGAKYWVKSSTMAIPVYESFGFQLNADRQQKNGIIHYPMILVP